MEWLAAATTMAGKHVASQEQPGFWHWLASEQTSNLATLIGYLALVIGGTFAWWRWRHDERVRRVEHIVSRITSLENSPGAQNAKMLLYNHDRHVPLFASDEPPERRYVRVTWEETARALIPPDMLEPLVDPKSTAIRDSFEDFLGRLGELELYLEMNVLTRNDGERVVGQWVRRFGLTARDTELIRNLRLYIAFRGMIRVTRLFRRYGVDLREGLVSDSGALRQEIAIGRWAAPPPPTPSLSGQPQSRLRRLTSRFAQLH